MPCREAELRRIPESNTTTVLGNGLNDGTYQETWVSGPVLHSTATICCDAVNGTAPIRAKSATVATNFNADLLDGLHLDEILSRNTLRQLVDSVNLLLRERGASDAEMIVAPELGVERFARVLALPTFNGIGEPSSVYVRNDRDPDVSTSQLVAQIGGNVSANGSTVPPSIDGLVGITS